MRNFLIGSAAVLILASPSALAAPSKLLWDQNANFGGSVNSQDDGVGAADAAADDFTVPSGQTWHVAEVDVSGVYFNGSGPASSESIVFYRDKNGKPDKPYREYVNLKCTDDDGSFQCFLHKPAKLPAGTWWVSVVASCSFGGGCGEWNWTENTVVQGNEAVWENFDGFGKCPTFKPLHICFGGAPADLAFDLKGKAVAAK